MSKHKRLENLARELIGIAQPKQDIPQLIFDALATFMPFIAVEVIVVNRKGEMLLTWREDRYWRGWHFPGGLLRFGESFEERLQKTVRRELGVKIKSHKFLAPKNYGRHERGHDVSLLFLCQLTGSPKRGQFFKTMPREIITVHQSLWQELRKILAGKKR